jgi:alkylation response protein AidB-like acyl-CoA dehydrogenase
MADQMWSTRGPERATAEEVDARWGRLLADINIDASARDAAGAPIPRRFFTEAGALGLQALTLPHEAGGEGMDPLTWTLVLERIGYLCRDTGFP